MKYFDKINNQNYKAKKKINYFYKTKIYSKAPGLIDSIDTIQQTTFGPFKKKWKWK